MKKVLLCLVLFFSMFSQFNAIALDNYPNIPKLHGAKIAVITDSNSCSRLALHVMNRNKKVASSLPVAEAILTVVRSGLRQPLNLTYDSREELREDIKRLSNGSAPYGHIYVYTLNSNSSVSEIFHSGFEWNDDVANL